MTTGIGIKTILRFILSGFLLVSLSSANADDNLLTLHRQARTAIAEAERAELHPRLPPRTEKPLSGAVELRQFGAARLVKAFDLAQQLAGEGRTALPTSRKTALYEPAATQGIQAARLVQDAIEYFGDELGRQNKALQQVIETHTPRALGPALSH